MASAEILKSYAQAQKASLDGSEYIFTGWSRGNLLNYPAVGIVGNRSKIPLFLEKISYSTTATQIEVYAITNTALLAAPSNSAFRYFNKRFITGNVSQEFGHLVGEITPAQYSAVALGEDLYTRKVNEGVFDFSQSNIILLGDPALAASTNCIVLVGITANSELFASFDVKQIYPLTNNI